MRLFFFFFLISSNVCLGNLQSTQQPHSPLPPWHISCISLFENAHIIQTGTHLHSLRNQGRVGYTEMPSEIYNVDIGCAPNVGIWGGCASFSCVAHTVQARSKQCETSHVEKEIPKDLNYYFPFWRNKTRLPGQNILFKARVLFFFLFVFYTLSLNVYSRPGGWINVHLTELRTSPMQCSTYVEVYFTLFNLVVQ